MDLSVKHVSRFRQSFCVKQLLDNLRVEQPGDIKSSNKSLRSFSEVTREDIDGLPRQFCFGKNISVDLSSQEFYVLESGNKFKKLDGRIDQNIVTTLSKADPQNVEAIDGSNCFGDSGMLQQIQV